MATPISPDTFGKRTERPPIEDPSPLKKPRLDFSPGDITKKTSAVFQRNLNSANDAWDVSDFLNSRPLLLPSDDTDMPGTPPRRASHPSSRRSLFGRSPEETDGASMQDASAHSSTTPPLPPESSYRRPPDIKTIRRITNQNIRTEYGKNAEKIRKQIEDLQNGTIPSFIIICLDHWIEITSIVKYLGAGQFNDAYLVQGNILGMPEDSKFELPDQFVIKILQNQWLVNAQTTSILGHELLSHLCIDRAFGNQKNNSLLRIAKSYDMELLQAPAEELNELQNHNPHKTLDPKAKEFIEKNIQHGFSLVEYIEGEELNNDLIEKHKEDLKQIIAFIYENNLPIDFISSNLRLETQRDGSKRIVGFDLDHPQGDRVWKEGTIKPILDSFAKKNPALFSFLDPREQRT